MDLSLCISLMSIFLLLKFTRDLSRCVACHNFHYTLIVFCHYSPHGSSSFLGLTLWNFNCIDPIISDSPGIVLISQWLFTPLTYSWWSSLALTVLSKSHYHFRTSALIIYLNTFHLMINMCTDGWEWYWAGYRVPYFMSYRVRLNYAAPVILLSIAITLEYSNSHMFCTWRCLNISPSIGFPPSCSICELITCSRVRRTLSVYSNDLVWDLRYVIAWFLTASSFGRSRRTSRS